ncbi:hypothetical protein ACSQ67_005236 [Phaseolus vulgaris]
MKPTATGFPVSDTSSYAPPPPPQPKPIVEWSSGLCDCFSDCGICCLTWWCPCVTFGRIAEIVDRGSSSCATTGALYTLLGLIRCACIYSRFYRSKMREQHGLEGSGCTDCFIHCCCEPCALSQEYRELQNRGFDMKIEQQSRGVAMTAVTVPSVEQNMNR